MTCPNLQSEAVQLPDIRYPGNVDQTQVLRTKFFKERGVSLTNYLLQKCIISQ